MKLAFTRMQGAGNDFVVLDGVSRKLALTPSQLRRLADRHFGVGCDQILLVEAPRAAGTDFRYRIFNADGGEVEQCGNGAPCFVRFVRERGLTDKCEIRVETAAAASARGYTSAARARRSLVERARARFHPRRRFDDRLGRRGQSGVADRSRGHRVRGRNGNR